MSTKLTLAQKNLLKEQRGTFVKSYKPGQKLIELGLVDAKSGSFGNITWTINDAGKIALNNVESILTEPRKNE